MTSPNSRWSNFGTSQPKLARMKTRRTSSPKIEDLFMIYCLSQMEQEIGVNNTKTETGSARTDSIIYKTEQDPNHRMNGKHMKIQKEDSYPGNNYASADFVVTTN
uniref:Uncharacterized protein n=1 Tax=Rhipilia penicilloides TaxID=1979422 RepID=A0A2P0QHQ0_9CHLO|nr:hypothetical protein [Rhipilia penicilloides]ARO74301.1 hypothetical protein [Rhipilia penicilloides]